MRERNDGGRGQEWSKAREGNGTRVKNEQEGRRRHRGPGSGKRESRPPMESLCYFHLPTPTPTQHPSYSSLKHLSSLTRTLCDCH